MSPTPSKDLIMKSSHSHLLSALCCGLLMATAPALHAQSMEVSAPAEAATMSPDDLVQKVSNDVLNAVKADKTLQAGDIKKLHALIETKVLPYVNFQRMTSGAVGRYWRQATPEQQTRLETEFRTMLLRTYTGALSQVRDQTVSIKPSRVVQTGDEVIVRSEIRGKGDPIQLDYRLEKSSSVGWKIYDMNVLGVWLVENYRNSFAQEINASGIDGLIDKLAQRNKTAAART
jgi:phospholipid transport system substrate-binding protein